MSSQLPSISSDSSKNPETTTYALTLNEEILNFWTRCMQDTLAIKSMPALDCGELIFYCTNNDKTNEIEEFARIPIKFFPKSEHTDIYPKVPPNARITIRRDNGEWYRAIMRTDGNAEVRFLQGNGIGFESIRNCWIITGSQNKDNNVRDRILLELPAALKDINLKCKYRVYAGIKKLFVDSDPDKLRILEIPLEIVKTLKEDSKAKEPSAPLSVTVSSPTPTTNMVPQFAQMQNATPSLHAGAELHDGATDSSLPPENNSSSTDPDDITTEYVLTGYSSDGYNSDLDAEYVLDGYTSDHNSDHKSNNKSEKLSA